MIRLVVFLAATLLFLVQPMVARQILPELGGSAAVWTTCLAFFQCTLLGGYLYAHLLVGRLPAKLGAGLHIGLLAAAALTLPVGLAGLGAAPAAHSPVPWLLVALARGVGPSFLVLAATTPLVTSWLARSDRPGARDPYFLFAASNLGSLLALLAYPLVLEPFLGLRQQAQIWSLGYGLLAVSLVVVASTTLGAPAPDSPELVEAPPPETSGVWRDRAQWLVYSAVPSSLMLGVTAHMANEVPALALLWVTPLALYLATFALVFAEHPPIPRAWALAAHPPLLCLLAVVLYVPTSVAGFIIHLAAFFASGLVLHDELARRRPPPVRLTEFYLWVATGGAMAGLFHSLVAPALFPVAAEYPLAILAAAALQPEDPPDRPVVSVQEEAQRLLQAVLDEDVSLPEGGVAEPAPPPPVPPLRPVDVGGPILMGVVLVAAMALLPWVNDYRDTVMRVGMLVVAGMIANYLRGRRIRFPLAVAAVIAGGFFGIRLHGVVALARSSHGVHRVLHDQETGQTRLYFGSTVHGIQMPKSAGAGPASYFHPDSSFGGLMKRAGARRDRVAVIGLGAGSLAWYSQPGQEMTFFELDPEVARLAADPRYFTFLSEAKGAVDVVLGDGRRMLALRPPESLGLFVLDAFSSDAVPIHLLTKEALGMYLEKLAPGGALAIHISNRHLRLDLPAMAGLQELGAAAKICGAVAPDDAAKAKGIAAATWIVAARDATSLAAWTEGDFCWKASTEDLAGAAWTDEYASVLPILRGLR